MQRCLITSQTPASTVDADIGGESMVNSQSSEIDGMLPLPFNLDQEMGMRGAIGLIVLASDQTIEQEFRHLTGFDGVFVYQSRILNDSHITPATLGAMEARLAEATAVILPGVPLDVVAFCCTSASMVIGEEQVFAQIRAVRPDVACTTPITAAFAAFKAFEARRIALITPYRDDVNQTIQRYLQAQGIEVPVMGSFYEEDDRRVCQISEASIRNAAMTLGANPAVDAVFISCTALRAAGIVAEIEGMLGKPVTSSNHALAWHCLRLAGIDDQCDDLGTLFQLDLAAELRG